MIVADPWVTSLPARAALSWWFARTCRVSVLPLKTYPVAGETRFSFICSAQSGSSIIDDIAVEPPGDSEPAGAGAFAVELQAAATIARAATAGANREWHFPN